MNAFLYITQYNAFNHIISVKECFFCTVAQIVVIMFKRIPHPAPYFIQRNTVPVESGIEQHGDVVHVRKAVRITDTDFLDIRRIL
jgi:hypothetical protein